MHRKIYGKLTAVNNNYLLFSQTSLLLPEEYDPVKMLFEFLRINSWKRLLEFCTTFGLPAFQCSWIHNSSPQPPTLLKSKTLQQFIKRNSQFELDYVSSEDVEKYCKDNDCTSYHISDLFRIQEGFKFLLLLLAIFTGDVSTKTVRGRTSEKAASFPMKKISDDEVLHYKQKGESVKSILFDCRELLIFFEPGELNELPLPMSMGYKKDNGGIPILCTLEYSNEVRTNDFFDYAAIDNREKNVHIKAAEIHVGLTKPILWPQPLRTHIILDKNYRIAESELIRLIAGEISRVMLSHLFYINFMPPKFLLDTNDLRLQQEESIDLVNDILLAVKKMAQSGKIGICRICNTPFNRSNEVSEIGRYCGNSCRKNFSRLSKKEKIQLLHKENFTLEEIARELKFDIAHVEKVIMQNVPTSKEVTL